MGKEYRSKDPLRPVQQALADLVFEATQRALAEFVGFGGQAVSAAHVPLEDYVFKVTPYSAFEALVQANGPGGEVFFTIKVYRDRT